MFQVRKGFAVVASAAIVVTLLGACSGTNNGSSQAAPTVSPSASPAPSASAAPTATPEKPIELLWLNKNAPTSDDTFVQKYLEQKFNVKITNMRVDNSTWNDQLNLKLASKEIPDVFFVSGPQPIQPLLEQYVSQGFLAEIPEETIREKMPEYAKSIDKYDPLMWADAKVDGKGYAIPMFTIEANTSFLNYYNGTWLKNIGYDAPPETLEQYVDVLTKFRNNDPDGNGQKDTYGISGMGKNVQELAFAGIFGAFQVMPFHWMEDENGKLVFGMVTEKARAAFKEINRLYKEGVIDPEFITNDFAKTRNDFIAQKFGTHQDVWYAAVPEVGSTTKAIAKNGGTLVTGKPVEGPYGPGVGFGWTALSSYIGMGIQVQGDAKKMDKIFEILNALYVDEEVFLTTKYGELGVHYDMVDGYPVSKEEWLDSAKRSNEVGTSMYSFFRGGSDELQQYYYPQDFLAFKKKMTENVPVLPNRVTFAVEAIAKYPNLNALQLEYFIKLIVGQVDTDAGFDNFVAEWKRSGGQEITDEVNRKQESRKQQ